MIAMQSLQKWGNGAGVRLPQKLRHEAGVEIGQPFEVSVNDGVIMLKPIKITPKPSLNTLLHGVTPDTIGGEFDWGHDIGKERL